MAEANTEPAEPKEPEEPKGEGGGEGGKDWKAISRMWEKRAKENAEKAKSWDEHEEKSKSELQKAQEKAKKAEEKLKQLEAKGEREEIRRKVAEETGVPASIIAGDDEDEMREFAKAVAKFAKPDTAPKTKNPGKFDKNAGADDAKRKLARQLFGGGED